MATRECSGLNSATVAWERRKQASGKPPSRDNADDGAVLRTSWDGREQGRKRNCAPIWLSRACCRCFVTNRSRRLAHWTAALPPDESGYVQRYPESVCRPI